MYNGVGFVWSSVIQLNFMCHKCGHSINNYDYYSINRKNCNFSNFIYVWLRAHHMHHIISCACTCACACVCPCMRMCECRCKACARHVHVHVRVRLHVHARGGVHLWEPHGAPWLSEFKSEWACVCAQLYAFMSKHNNKLQLVDFVKSIYKPDYWIEAQINKSFFLLRTLPFLRRHTDVMTCHHMCSHLWVCALGSKRNYLHTPEACVNTLYCIFIGKIYWFNIYTWAAKKRLCISYCHSELITTLWSLLFKIMITSNECIGAFF